jgi:hypothetical protein
MGATWVDGHLDLQVRGVLKWGLRRPHGDNDGLQENRDVPVPNRPCADAPGHPERQIARGHSMGWGKLAALRKLAEERGWLDAQTALPEEAQIAAALGIHDLDARTASRAHRRLAGPGLLWPRTATGIRRPCARPSGQYRLRATSYRSGRQPLHAIGNVRVKHRSFPRLAKHRPRVAPETATRLSKAGPEVYEAAALKSPWYSQRFTSRFRNTGMAESCCASSSPVGSIMAPRPHRITRGACGFSTRVRQAATTAPFFVGK